MRKKASLFALIISMTMSMSTLTSCDKDDDDDNKNKVENNDNKKEESGNEEKDIELSDIAKEYVVNANLMDMAKWQDTIHVELATDSLIDIKFKATNAPTDTYRISDAEFLNVKVSKSGNTFAVSATDPKFEARLGMSPKEGMPTTMYSTKDENAKLTIKSMEGGIGKEGINIEINLSAGKMPLTIPITLASK